MAQNKDTQKVDSSNRCHAMIHHQNADAIVLDVCHFEYYQGDECLSNVHWQGPWRQHFDDEYGYAKIIGKP
jgi:hypothetical protein